MRMPIVPSAASTIAIPTLRFRDRGTILFGRDLASGSFEARYSPSTPVAHSALFEPTDPRHARGGFVLFGAWLVVTGIALALTPNPAGHGTHKQLGLAACPSTVIFDRPCPGCGLTTSWTALLHGDLPHALSAHLLGPLTYLAFTALAFLSLYAAATGRRIVAGERWQNRALVAFAIVFFGYAAWRFGTHPGYGTVGEGALRAAISR